MISENGEPINPTGAVPTWSVFDQVRITATWCDRRNEGVVVNATTGDDPTNCALHPQHSAANDRPGG